MKARDSEKVSYKFIIMRNQKSFHGTRAQPKTFHFKAEKISFRDIDSRLSLIHY